VRRFYAAEFLEIALEFCKSFINPPQNGGKIIAGCNV